MEATELRIGNIVLSDRCICEVFHIYGGSYINCTLKTKQGNTINALYNLLKPIPLTEEWLIKLGFEKGGYEGLFWYKDELEFAGINYLDKEIPEYQFLNFSVSDERIIQIYYVHQLQNLYHALTYQELGCCDI